MAKSSANDNLEDAKNWLKKIMNFSKQTRRDLLKKDQFVEFLVNLSKNAPPAYANADQKRKDAVSESLGLSNDKDKKRKTRTKDNEQGGKAKRHRSDTDDRNGVEAPPKSKSSFKEHIKHETSPGKPDDGMLGIRPGSDGVKKPIRGNNHAQSLVRYGLERSLTSGDIDETYLQMLVDRPSSVTNEAAKKRQAAQVLKQIGKFDLSSTLLRVRNFADECLREKGNNATLRIRDPHNTAWTIVDLCKMDQQTSQTTLKKAFGQINLFNNVRGQLSQNMSLQNGKTSNESLVLERMALNEIGREVSEEERSRLVGKFKAYYRAGRNWQHLISYFEGDMIVFFFVLLDIGPWFVSQLTEYQRECMERISYDVPNLVRLVQTGGCDNLQYLNENGCLDETMIRRVYELDPYAIPDKRIREESEGDDDEDDDDDDDEDEDEEEGSDGGQDGEENNCEEKDDDSSEDDSSGDD